MTRKGREARLSRHVGAFYTVKKAGAEWWLMGKFRDSPRSDPENHIGISPKPLQSRVL